MRFILMLLALGASGYVLTRATKARGTSHNAAFAKDQAEGGDIRVRDAGPDAMRDQPKRDWTEVDQTSDESFPASDPPGTY